MGINHYIFLTVEGYSYQPDSESILPDIDNLQVIGFYSGENAEKAYTNLIKQNPYILRTRYDEIFSYKLDVDYQKSKKRFYLSDYKKSANNY